MGSVADQLPCARQLHTATTTTAAIPSAVLGHVPIVLRWMRWVWGLGLAAYLLGARDEQEHEEERGNSSMPVHPLLPNCPIKRDRRKAISLATAFSIHSGQRGAPVMSQFEARLCRICRGVHEAPERSHRGLRVPGLVELHSRSTLWRVAEDQIRIAEVKPDHTCSIKC